MYTVVIKKGRRKFFIPFSKIKPGEVGTKTISVRLKQATSMAYSAAKENRENLKHMKQCILLILMAGLPETIRRHQYPHEI